MSAEQRWADRVEWEQECGEVEVKSHWVIPADWGERCDVNTCLGIAMHGIEIGLVSSRGGAKFSFCMNHSSDDFAFEFYRRMRQKK